jgi:CRP/FNR family transcriptional regulator
MKPLNISCVDCNAKDCSILRSCPVEILQYFDKKKYCMTYRPDQYIIREGSKIDGVYVVCEGIVKMHVKGRFGRDFIMRLGKPGDILGHADDREQRQSSSVSAVEPTTVCFIERNDFEQGMKQCTAVQRELMLVFKNELKNVWQRTIQLVQMNVREKIADALLHIAEVYGIKEGNPPIEISLTRQEISDMTGTTKEQVSKIISEFRADDLIDAHGKKISILNYKGLKKVAGIE